MWRRRTTICGVPGAPNQYATCMLSGSSRAWVRRYSGGAGIAAPLPLPEVVAAALRQQRKRVLEMRLAAGPAWREHGLVFPSEVGTPQEPRNVARAWDRLRRQIGMPWLGMHGLRHGFGSLLAARGVHPRVAMELMRHSQFSLTMEIYTHVAPELAREAVREIDRALGS